MDTIPIIKISNDQFKFINNSIWHNVMIDCYDCRKHLIEISAIEIPDKYPANRPIVFKCTECGGGHERKILFVVE